MIWCAKPLFAMLDLDSTLLEVQYWRIEENLHYQRKHQERLERFAEKAAAVLVQLSSLLPAGGARRC